MYRTLVSHGPLVGVPSGPYAGGERKVDFFKLPPASQARLLDAMAGRGPVQPILKTEARLALHLRPFRPGVYLFPIDVVDARSPTEMRILPLGSVVSASISRDALVLRFDDGAEASFPVKSAAEGEETWALLERTQRTLEELTYGGDLAAALSLDPFYEVRADDGWAAVLPGGPAQTRRAWARLTGHDLAERGARRRRRTSIAVLAGVAALPIAAATGYMYHTFIQEPERRGTGAVDGAYRKNEAQVHVVVPEGVASETEVEDAITRFRSRAASPGIASRVESIVRAYQTTREPLHLQFASTFDPSLAEGGVPTPFARSEAEARQARLERVFAIVFSEAIPARVLPVVYDTAPRVPGKPWIVVEARHAWSASKGAPGVEVVFDAWFYGVGADGPHAFRLTMPPSALPTARVRDKSLFSEPREDDLNARLLDAMFSRAYDRLYDELYTTFFTGDPRVPESSREELDRVARTFGMAGTKESR